MVAPNARSPLWVVPFMLAACSDPPHEPTVVRPSFHRHDDGRGTVVVDANGRGVAKTIQEGINMAPVGGRVLVLPGTYNEALVIDKGLTLEGIGGKRQGRTVIASPPGLPTATIRIATANPVVMSDLTVLVRGQNGILAQGIFDVALRRLTMVFEEVPPSGASRLVRPENTASQTGAQARLVVRESFFDAHGLPGTLAISIAADIDAVIERNVLRRTGNSCIFVNGSSAINVDIADNDLDECAMRGANSSAIEVGPIVGSTIQATVGVVNIVGNRIRNSGASCPPHTAIRYELYTGRIERNSISDVVQECAVPSPLALPAAIWVGSLRSNPPASPVVRFNDLQGNAHAGLRVAPNITTPIDASCNWWGSASGPTSSAWPPGTGDAVVVEEGGTTPMFTPLARAPIARSGGHLGDDDDDDDQRGEHARCGSTWSDPVNLGSVINSDARDDNVSLSPDELSLYLTSDRTGGQGARDVWVARRASRRAPWGPPVNLGAVINSPVNDVGPTLSADGHRLFFFSNRPGGHGDNDIYVSYRADPDDDFAWEAPVNLGPLVNTDRAESGAEFVNATTGGTAMLFFNRRVALGATPPFDLFSVPIGADGLPSAAATPISELNTPSSDFGPELSDDGLELLFASDRPGTLGANDLWIARRATIHDAWSPAENLGAPVSTASGETTPSLSANGRTLIFASTRPGGVGNEDLWMSTRRHRSHQDQGR